MQVIVERARLTCDHCGEMGKGISLTTEFAHSFGDSVQLCEEHARYFATEILKILPKAIESTEILSKAEAAPCSND